MRLHRGGIVGAVMLAVVAAACTSSSSSTQSTASTTAVGGAKGAPTSITVGSAGFSENVTLARIYGGALEKAGYKVSYKLKIGAREVVEPALESGQIDLVPEYAGNYLNFLDPAVNGLPLDQATTQLQAKAKTKGLTVLTPSAAADGDVVAATKDFVAKNSLTSISDLKKLPAPVSLAGPAECQTRPTCLLGLQSVYGLQVKFVSTGTDSGGPVTKAALDKGDAVIGRLFSTDTDLGKKYVALDDDKNFQLAGNIVPVVRSSKVDDKLAQTLDKVSAALTTAKLTALDDQTDNQKQDPADVATMFLKQNNLG